MRRRHILSSTSEAGASTRSRLRMAAVFRSQPRVMGSRPADSRISSVSVSLKSSAAERRPGLDSLCLETTVPVMDALVATGVIRRGAATRSNAALCLNLTLRDDAAPITQDHARPLYVIPFPYGTLALASLVNLTMAAGRSSRPVRVYVRRAAFDQLTDSYGAERLQRLDLTPRDTEPDTVLTNLAACLDECLQGGHAVTSELTDHVIQAIHCHVAHVYGGIVFPERLAKGGLARWQLKLALEQLDRLLDRGRPPLAGIARVCGLSVSHFSRAFTHSTGLSPTHWSKRRRLEHAKELLRSTTRTLTDISQVCGFADQSHFSNQFSLATGTTPARWRERHQCGNGRR